MRRVPTLILLALLLVTGCAGEGGGPSAESPSRTADRSPSRAETTRAEPTREEPTRAEPTREEPTRAEPTREEPTAEPEPNPPATVTETVRPPTPRVTQTEETATEPTETASPVPVAGGEDSSALPWLLLAAVAVSALIGWAVHASHRRTATGRDWNAQVTDVYARGAVLRDAVSAAVLLEPDPARRADIQRRADALTQVLYTLRDTAPTEDDRLRVSNVLSALQAVRSAIDLGQLDSATLQPRLRTFEQTLNALHAPVPGLS